MPSTPALPAATEQTTAPAVRLHHLDALRAGALLLGVLLHALMPFLPGGGWLVEDARSSAAALVPVAVIHLFRVVLFMMLAGYFGRMVLQRRGTGAYVQDRLRRIGLPLVGFWPLLFGLMVLALVADAVVRGADAAAAPPAGSAPPWPLGIPTMHLWFLLLLMEIVLVVVAVRSLLVRVLGAERAGRASARIGTLLSSRGGVLVAALPYLAALLVQGREPTGIVEPYTLVPVPGATIGYGGAFLVGWFLHAREGGLERASRLWGVQLALAAVLSAAAFLVPASAAPVLVMAAVALAGWTWVYGLLGLAGRFLASPSPAVRYVADASYWIYLLHFPLLLLVEVPLADLALPILVKLTIALVVVLGVLVLSYDLLVRSTWVGAWLNGRRRPRALVAPGRRSAGATARAAG